MRTENLARAQLLMQQDRFAQAEGELRLYLASEPEDGSAHALLAVCLLRQEKLDAAEVSARQSVALEPTESFSHQILGTVLLERNDFHSAQAAVEEAIQLNPVNGDLFALRGLIALHRSKWQEALDAAEQGLEVEPDNLDCINVQAQALVKLGRKAEATRTIDGALAQAPDNAYTHANQGWALLHQNQPRKALEHFREALRLDPENDFARAGMVEALKARNIVYRLMLSFFLWMARLPPQVQIGVVIGGFVGIQVLGTLEDSLPIIAPLTTPIIYLYAVFALMTWVADPIFNLLLRLDRFGKHALSADQRVGSTVFGIDLALALAGGATALSMWLINGSDLIFTLGLVAGLVFGVALIPVSVIWKCQKGWPRWTMGLYTLGFIAFGWFAFLGVPVLAAMEVVSKESPQLMTRLFFYGAIATQFIANALVMARPRR